MNTHPFVQWTLAEAIDEQHRLVDAMHHQFNGLEVLEAGDYGATGDLGRSRTTAKVEAVLAEYFGAEDVALVSGAGTGAIRSALMAVLEPGASVVIHAPPMYATTSVTFRAMGLDVRRCDFNREDEVRRALEEPPAMLYVQHARQQLEDDHDVGALIALARELAPDTIVMVDDNYTAFQVPRIGTQLGAQLSAFSLFKLLGEPGVGCVLGDAGSIARIRDDAYSGGTKVQGPIALSSLRGLVYAPVALAIQAQAVAELVARINDGELDGVRQAYVANHQERVALIELDAPIAAEVIACAWRWGATNRPVGSQSQFEVNAMVYRLSRAMCEGDPELARRTLRVNPLRAGASTVLAVLREALHTARTGEAEQVT
jgi:hypothetical protein